MDFNNLKLYRKKFGLTQEQAAERLGVSRQAVAKWERGETLPDIDNIIAMADMYEISIDSLVRNMTTISDTGDNTRKHMFGVVKVNDKGQITLPKKSREIFNINAGDTLLLLGDEERGMALVKVDEITN